MTIRPNDYCIAWSWHEGPILGLYLGEVINPFMPYVPMRFRVARLTGETFEAMGIAALPRVVAVLDDWRAKRGRFAETNDVPKGAA